MKHHYITQRKFLIALLFLFAFGKGYSQTNVIMTLNNPINVNASTFEFDVWIKNHGSSQVKLSGYCFGIDHNSLPPSFSNGGNIFFSMLPGTRDPNLSTLDPNPIVIYLNHQFKLLTTNVGVNSSVVLPPATSYRLGRFKVTNSVQFATNYNPALNLNGSGGSGLQKCVASAYLNGSTVLSTLNITNGLGLTTSTPGLLLNPSCAPTFGTVNSTACDSYLWVNNGVTYSSSGNYSHLVPGGNSCGGDTTTTLNLTINQSTFTNSTITSPGSYTWPANGVTYTTTGVYTHITINPAGCTNTATLNLTIPVPLSLTVTENQPISCYGNNDGSAIASAIGDPPITYSVDGGIYNNTTGLFFGLTPGTHTICAKDVHGITSCQTISYIEPDPLAMTFNIDSFVSCEGNDGALSVNITGGTNVLQGYLTWWTNSFGDTLNDVLTNNFALNLEGLPAGNYNVAIEDDHGCFFNANGILPAAPPIVVNASIPSIVCNGGSTTILPNATGGVPYSPLTYKINGASVASSYSAGIYTIMATDAKGCTGSTTVVITEPASIINNVNATACNIYTWHGTTYTTSGTYTYTSLNAQGCVETEVLNLTINLSTNSTTTITATGSYTWAVNGVTYTASGTYVYTSINAAGCPNTDILNLTVEPILNITKLEDQPISCHGNHDGSVQVFAVGVGPFTFNVDGGTYTNTTGYFTGLGPGTHYFCVKDVYGTIFCCPIPVTFIDPDPLAMTFTVDSMVSCLGNDGALTANITGGTNVLQGYLTWWTNAAGDTLNDVLTNNFALSLSGLPAGTYNVAIEDDHGCFFNANGVLPSAPPIVVSAIVPPIVCHNGSTTITPSATGGVPYTPLTYTVNGASVSSSYSSGTYTIVATDAKGCTGSTVLTISNPLAIQSTTTITACNTYSWNGTTYTASGTYSTSFIAANGCDSTATLNLTINNSTTNGGATITACDSYLWNGTTYTASGVYTYTSLNAAGCINTATLNLTINQSTTNGGATITACDSYLWNGTTYTASGTYTYTSLNTTGCVNTATLNLTINNSTTNGGATITACDSYLWNGTTYTASGVYTYTSLNTAGCVNTATLNLTINNSTTNGGATITACDSYLWNGTTYTASGTYTYTSLNTTGCVNTATLNLTINNSTTNGGATITSCDSYLWNGTTYTASGVYTYTSLNTAGCVNTATLNLTINNSTTNGGATITACDSYLWNGATYTASGTYTYTSLNTAGCVNTATLNLTINQSTTNGGATITACDSYLWNGTTYTASGVYTYTSLNTAGCVNTATLNLTINNSTTNGGATITACNSYLWNGTTYTASGVFTYTSLNSAGCVNTATLNLTINQSTTSSTSATACNIYTWHGTTYTTSGTYTYTSLNAQGCVETEVLNLTINLSTNSTTTITATGSYTWAVNGVTYTASGTYVYTSINAAGCPNTDILNLTVEPILNITKLEDQPISCHGNHDGSVQVFAVGVGPFTFNVDGGTYTNTTGYFTGLGPGTHYFCVKDVYGTIFCCPIPVTFIDPDPLAMTFTVDSMVSCLGNDGALTANITGGTNVLQGYLTWWTNAAGDTLNDVLTNNFALSLSGLPAGTYNVAIEDDHGCFFNANGVLPSAPPIVVSAIVPPIVCHNGSTTITPSATGGVPYTPLTYTVNGASVSSSYSSGTYTIVATDAKGCTGSTVLTISNPLAIQSTTTITACNTYSWNGTTYTASGTYSTSFIAANGCDSTATLNLTINNSTTNGGATITACDSYLWNGTTYTASGVYTYTSLNAAGCINTATLNLTINQSTTNGGATITACDSYLWNGTTYTASGTYTYTSLNTTGCVNTATLNLTINNSTTNGGATITACDSYLWNGTTYTASGVYTYTSLNTAGCVNTATLNLTINNSTTNGGATITACDSYLWNGTTYTASGTYTYTSLNTTGCVNTATLNLTINNSTTNGGANNHLM